MEIYLDKILEFISGINNIYAYIILFISAILENLVPPVPGDTVTAIGAFLVASGKLSYSWVYLSTLIGSTCGYILLYFAGRMLGREFFLKHNFRFFPVQKIHNAEQKFHKSGYYIVLMNRFFPGIRSVISITSGLINLHPVKVTVCSLLSAAVWNLIWIHAGYSVGGNWSKLKEKIVTLRQSYNKLFIAAILSIFILYICYRFIKYLKNRNN